MVNAIGKELVSRAEYLTEPVETIYFGGGTPSILLPEEIQLLLKVIHDNFQVTEDSEITLEANPDDLNRSLSENLFAAGINRLSIGIQSFREEDLRLMNRAHSAKEAIRSAQNAKEAGFENITIDLIYGIPGLGLGEWEENLSLAMELNIQHVSAYGLTIEEKTVFSKWVANEKLRLTSDEQFLEQFKTLKSTLAKHGFEHYEVSNFGKPGYYSKHNSAYWLGKPYLGVGPSAHSFNGSSRRWNIANNPTYLRHIENGGTYFEEEQLSAKDRLNEYLMTSLRTKWGLDLNKLRNMDAFDEELLMSNMEAYIQSGDIELEGAHIRVSPTGLFIVDTITRAAFF